MDSQTVVVACPECGRPATIIMYTITGRRFIFEFACPHGHVLADGRVQQLWIGAHQ